MFGKKLFGRSNANTEVPPLRDVLLTKESFDDPDPVAAVSTNITITNHFLQMYRYRVEELPPEAIESYSVDFYLAQVNNGGHEQFAHNAAGQPNTWKFARSGLEAMGASEHLKAFDRFKTIIDRGDSRARDLISRGGFGAVDAEVEEIDAAFHAANTAAQLAELNGNWLKSRPNLRVLPATELEEYINRFSEEPGVAARMAQR